MSYHNPVLLKECIDGLNINPDGTYVDLTFGGGGHSRAILEKLGPNGRLFAFDQDPDAQANVPNDPRFTLIAQNFALLEKFLRFYKAIPVDGILADLGVSSHQFDEIERGFSIRGDADLDMRMNPTAGQTAAEVLAEYDEADIANILYRYGEVKASRPIARAIVQRREEEPIVRVNDLLSVIQKWTPKFKGHKFQAQVFQALRIEVNKELEVLEQMLQATPKVLKEGGRLVVMSYHSLEDRMVKQFIREGVFKGEAERDMYGNRFVPFNPVVRKAIVANEEEIESNSRARSARLRIAERTDLKVE
ncbi:16S rRNA (cytosine(1402)-N(4))-methyltransferase RsmH [Phaeocystidibacter luteus]|uniref:Ribosomal RNA small subunit methyltransferase H n=1 Tax=Phaeocystidibacter luteus TaxID=911197 RepID=A0A6N6RJ60_9FLAO|nr:16S rRNA (cytosine(1402)-N(4))-methyltransferase RsmH [Phaeocystidibacter luteus]KAB2813664.1 16S rRNA (cytosine(1402)-N(4))-methyltransferase RsmH [Phaeocystidibacter luteus]